MHFSSHLTKPTSGVASHHGHFFTHEASPSAKDPGPGKTSVEEGENERESVFQNQKGDEAGHLERRVDSPLPEHEDQAQNQNQEQSQQEKEKEKEKEKKDEDEEEISEWIEGKDIVIERKSCIPGEDVQVEVLKGAAGATCGEGERARVVREAKERMRKRGKEAEGKW